MLFINKLFLIPFGFINFALVLVCDLFPMDVPYLSAKVRRVY